MKSNRFEALYYNLCGCDVASIAPCSGAKIEEVIIVYVTRGKGTGADPAREITQVWSKDGKFIAERDPLQLPFTGDDGSDTLDSGG